MRMKQISKFQKQFQQQFKKQFARGTALAVQKYNQQFGRSRKSKIAAVAVLSIAALSFLWIQFSGAEVYSLTIGGKEAGYLTEQSLIKQAASNIKADYKERGIELTIDEEAISCEPTDLKEGSITALNLEDLKNVIAASEACTANGWAINIDGKNIAVVASEQSANQILEEIKNHYLTSGSETISTAFKENVLVTQAAVRIAEFMEPENAEAKLLAGETAPVAYTVKDGDTLWDIAAINGVSPAELQNANPGFDPNKLKIGQQLNLVALKPYITVLTKERITATEKIDFNTVYEETNTLNKGEVKVKTAGVYGSKLVSSEVTKENGIPVETKVIASTVTEEPKDQVALKGTKAGSYMASRGGGRAISVNGTGSEIVAYAKSFLGTPYVHGGSSPKGFDCSGFTQYVYAHFGGSLPRTSAGQYGTGDYVEKSQLKPGDLVFFTSSSRISHVGIYVGGGSFIHSPQSGEDVKISSFSSTTLKYCGAVRASN